MNTKNHRQRTNDIWMSMYSDAPLVHVQQVPLIAATADYDKHHHHTS